MGEEKPSVPWVLEDYETSQVGKIPIKQKRDNFQNKTKRNDSQLTFVTNIVCFVKVPPA